MVALPLPEKTDQAWRHESKGTSACV